MIITIATYVIQVIATNRVNRYLRIYVAMYTVEATPSTALHWYQYWTNNGRIGKICYTSSSLVACVLHLLL